MLISPGNLVLVLGIAPFVAAMLAPILTRLMGHHAGWLLAVVPATIFALLATLIDQVAAGETIHVAFAWLPSLGVDLSLTLDGLSLVFALTISGIGALIILYSGAYLKGHPHQGRFLGFMLAFMGAMLGIVLADGLVPLYVFWELTAVTSYLLIGFDHARQTARRAALQALIVTSAGGLCLLLAAVLIHQQSGQWNLGALLGHAADFAALPLAAPIAVLIFAAAFTKSAQVPFHFWLPNAMEAPTPVSAYLHSAAMVQGGVYLLARFSPLLGSSPLWAPCLTIFGAVTLLWGALGAIRQTDLKQKLAQSTIASLGLLVLMLGIGGKVAVTAVILYFVAHALYKAAFFLVVGLIDHETGVRDITVIGGLKEKMALSFIAAILAGFSMLGLPPVLGYLAKEEVYAAVGPMQWAEIFVPIALVGGNAVLGAIALALVARPFMGPVIPTPKAPHEGPMAMLAGPLILGVVGIGAAVLSAWTGDHLIAPAASAVFGSHVASHLGFALDPADPAIWLSLLTWVLSAAIYWKLDALRTLLRRLEGAIGWSFDKGFDLAMAGLLGLAHLFATRWQNGRLRFYLAVLFAAMAAALILPLAAFGGLPALPSWPDLLPVEWATIALAVAGLAAVVLAPTLLIAIIALGVQGTAIALIYLLFGAPDLSFTQFMVETLSVVMFALVMTRLKLDRQPRRTALAASRDGVVALLCGGGVAVLLIAILAGPFDNRLSDFFAANAATLAHGRNIVNVILVDFRGLDTLGEISVVMAAGIAVLALIASGRRAEKPAPEAGRQLVVPRKRPARTKRPSPRRRPALPKPEAAP